MSIETDGKSLVGLLDMLAPAPEPQPIPMTPQTWGWAVLALTLAAAIAGGVYLYRQHRRANAYRRAALLELETAGDHAAKVAQILRRTALTAYPRTQVASLYGQDWINFLKQAADNITISDAVSRHLTRSPYTQTQSSPDVANTARAWIKTHEPIGRR